MRAESGPYLAKNMAQACRGTLVCGDAGAVFGGISTDSRDIKSNDLFVPLRGANYDGHDFLLPALEAGARGCLVDRDVNGEILKALSNCVLIQVQDTLRALSDLASAHRKMYPVSLIAVTGSSGKTTVKEMIAAVLHRTRSPLISQGNLNNVIGLPMTILNLGPGHTAAVVEAGINQPGEMDLLALAAAPDVAVITTVGPVHLEGLGTIENVAREKFKLVRGLRAGGTAVLPAENHYLQPLLAESPRRVWTFGLDSGDFRAERISQGERTSFEIVSPVGRAEMTLSVPGRHNIGNALAAAAACSALEIGMDEVSEALSEFIPPSMRMEIIPLPRNRTLIRDCYNANPQSTAAALEVLASMGDSAGSLAVLADMMELGQRGAELHAETGRKAARLGIAGIVFVGNYGKHFHDGFVSGGGDPGAVSLAPDKDTAWRLIQERLDRFETILVKGSRAMRMEVIADRILEEN